MDVKSPFLYNITTGRNLESPGSWDPEFRDKTNISTPLLERAGVGVSLT
jgi:hypothetical protein